MTGRLPNLVFAGVMKGGTTSLFTYLAQHPDFFPSKVKETNFFRPFYAEKSRTDVADLSLDDYRAFFDGAADQAYVFESSPGYINGGRRLAEHMERNLPDLRVMFLLREPVDRARSYFEYQQGLLNLPKTMGFADYVAECLDQEARAGKPDWAHRGLWGGRYAPMLREWSDVFGPRMSLLFFDDLRRDARAFTDSLCRMLGARGVDGCAIDFSVENKTRLSRNDLLHRVALAANSRFEPFLRRNRALKKLARDFYFAMNGASPQRRSDEAMETARAYFESPNAELRRLMAERFPTTPLPAWLSHNSDAD